MVAIACVATCGAFPAVGDTEADTEADGDVTAVAVALCELPPHAASVSRTHTTNGAAMNRRWMARNDMQGPSLAHDAGDTAASRVETIARPPRSVISERAEDGRR